MNSDETAREAHAEETPGSNATADAGDQSAQSGSPARKLQTTVVAAATAATLVVGGAVAAVGYQQGWFEAERQPEARPTVSQSTPASRAETTPAEPSEAPTTPAPEPAAPREVSRATWMEFRGDGQPVHVFEAESPVIVDPLGPFLSENYSDSIYRVDNGEVDLAWTDPQTSEFPLGYVMTIRGGFAHLNSPSEVVLPSLVDVEAKEVVFTPETLLFANSGEWVVEMLEQLSADTFLFSSRDYTNVHGSPLEGGEVEAAYLAAPTANHVTKLDGTDVWRKPTDDVSVGWGWCPQGRHNGLSPWMVQLAGSDCSDALNLQTGALITPAKGKIVATYDDHLVTVDQNAGTFIAYDADGNVEAEFAVPASVVKMVSPVALRNQAFEDAGDLLDLGLEVSYPDLIAGLQYLQDSDAQPAAGMGSTSAVKWQILPGGNVMKVDASAGDTVTLTRSDTDQHWQLPCANVHVIAAGERALCLDGDASGTLFNLEQGGNTSQVWQISDGVAVDATLYPFNNDGWVINSRGSVWVLPN